MNVNIFYYLRLSLIEHKIYFSVRKIISYSILVLRSLSNYQMLIDSYIIIILIVKPHSFTATYVATNTGSYRDVMPEAKIKEVRS